MSKGKKFVKWVVCFFRVFAYPVAAIIFGWGAYSTFVEINKTTGFLVLLLFVALVAAGGMSLVLLWSATRLQFNSELLMEYITANKENKQAFVNWCLEANVQPRFYRNQEIKKRKEVTENVTASN